MSNLCPYLDSKGWALHSLASLPHIWIAAACSTPTHGCGEKNGNLSTAVSGLEFVDVTGKVMELSRQRIENGLVFDASPRILRSEEGDQESPS